MDYEIYPLSITQVEWGTFVNVCRDHLGYSPTRGIDACHLDLKDPAAYLGCLDMENHPLVSLRHEGPQHDHVSMSFIMVLDDEGLLLVVGTPLKVLYKTHHRRHVAIVTGTMEQWKRTIVYACRVDAPRERRLIMNQVLRYFEQGGFREVFSTYSKHEQVDGTFILK